MRKNTPFHVAIFLIHDTRFQTAHAKSAIDAPGTHIKKAAEAAFFMCLDNAYAENDEPQPQVLVAPGFLMTNCAPSRPSE